MGPRDLRAVGSAVQAHFNRPHCSWAQMVHKYAQKNMKFATRQRHYAARLTGVSSDENGGAGQGRSQLKMGPGSFLSHTRAFVYEKQ